ncbi:lysM domain receptor-like kinase 3 [Carica papaya]|uniref:lysM domain receptor-like kinase 3 n=1 Tax=Carica papaya TaxID=3649 RepID=UPI000B8C9C7A|nr:lysM domain receptor-like kinase 3 [Carica papaya]
MCRSKKTTSVIEPSHRSKAYKSSPTSTLFTRSSNSTSTTITSSSYGISTSNSSVLSLKSPLSVLPENPHIYEFSEIRTATNNFLAKPFSSSSSSSTSWRCNLRGKDVVVFQRKMRRIINTSELSHRLSVISRSHHSSLVKLLGATLSSNYVFLVYEYVPGANLVTCLRNPRNPDFTVLSRWVLRAQIAADFAHGLEYIHHCSGLDSTFVHNHIQSTSIIVTEDPLRVRICHFGTAELCEARDVTDRPILSKSKSNGLKIEGTKGYMAPELKVTGVSTQKSDVYAFGVVLLELISGKEALKYDCDESAAGGYRSANIIDSAREVVGGGGVGLRRWVDRRLKDSYPVEVAEKMVLVGLECVKQDPEERPDMGRVAGLMSKLYLESMEWEQKIVLPVEFSVSMAPR